MKICSKCGVEQNLGEFHRDRRTSDGRRADCATCDNARRKQYYQNNKEKVKATAHKWQEENPEKARAAWRRYYRNHKEECQTRHKKWWKDNPDKTAAYDAKKRTAGWLGSIPVGPCCVSCGTVENLERDHIIPVAGGGITVLDNIQTLCTFCNSAKGAFEFSFEAVLA